MFCKWCGKRIKNTAKSCPLCGREQESLFNGNGFWDLCNVKDEKKVISIPTENVQTKEDMVNKTPMHTQTFDKKKSFDAKKQVGLEVACLLVCVISCVLFFINVCFMSNRTDAIKGRLESVHENIDVIFDSFEKVSNQTNLKLASIETELSQITTTKIQNDLKENEAFFVQSNYESSDRISINGIKINSHDYLSVHYVSFADEYNKATYTWQSSADYGATWKTIGTSSCIVIDNELDVRYRVYVDLNQQFIVDLMRPNDVVVNDYPFGIYVEETNDKDLLLYRLAESESEGFSFAWQESFDGNLWSDINSDECCLINTDNGKQYRLIVNVNSYLYSEYSTRDEMTNGIDYPDSDDSESELESSYSVDLDQQKKKKNKKEDVEQNGDEQGLDKFSDDESIEINSDLVDEENVAYQVDSDFLTEVEAEDED